MLDHETSSLPFKPLTRQQIARLCQSLAGETNGSYSLMLALSECRLMAGFNIRNST